MRPSTKRRRVLPQMGEWDHLVGFTSGIQNWKRRWPKVRCMPQGEVCPLDRLVSGSMLVRHVHRGI